MQIIINTDHNVTISTDSEAELVSTIGNALSRFEDRVTRVEVHLSDQSAGRSTGNDIECRLEARPEGRSPEITTNSADTPESSVRGAAQKMSSLLDSMFGKLDHHKGSSSMGDSDTR